MKFSWSVLFLLWIPSTAGMDWLMEDPQFYANSPDAGFHTATCEHSDGPISVIEVYANPDGPDTGNPEYACYSMGNELGSDRTLLGGPDDLEGLGITSEDLDDSGDSTTWIFSFNELIETDSIMSEVTEADGTTTAAVNLCIRFALTNADGTVVSYRELAISMLIRIDNTFSGLAFDTDPSGIQIYNNLELEYNLFAKVCDDTTYFNTGAVIPICVCTDQYPVTKVTSVQELTFTDSRDTVEQISINEGGVYDYGLSAIKECDLDADNEYCCRVDTVLKASFYSGLGGGSSAVMEVIASGMADLDINGDRRRLAVPIRRRKLVVSEGHEFQTTILVAEDTGSGAWRSCVVIPTMVAVAVAAVLAL